MPAHYLDRARMGDRHALAKLSTRLRPRLARMAMYYSRRCSEEIGDLQQEAWLGVLEALPRLNVAVGDPEQSLLCYGRWRILDAVKRSLCHEQPIALDESVTTLALTPDMLDELSASSFLNGLSPLQRRILTCLLAGYTWRETGALLGCTSANIAYHVRRIGKDYLLFHEIESVGR